MYAYIEVKKGGVMLISPDAESSLPEVALEPIVPPEHDEPVRIHEQKASSVIGIGSLVELIYADKPDQPRAFYFANNEHKLHELPKKVQDRLADASFRLLGIDTPLGIALKGKKAQEPAHITTRGRGQRDIIISSVENFTDR